MVDVENVVLVDFVEVEEVVVLVGDVVVVVEMVEVLNAVLVEELGIEENEV